MNIDNPIKNCRVCGGQLYFEPLLCLHNMPKAAQFFPDGSMLANEAGSNLEICQCSACNLIQLNSQPVHYYREVVRASAYSKEMEAFRLQQFADFVIKQNMTNKKGIEIGCGRGEYLKLLKQVGINAYGLEFAQDSVSQCKKDGYKVFQGFVNDVGYQLPEAPYDAFFILNWLEHLPQPHLTLRGIAENLSKNAVGLVEVPNFDMILAKNLFSEFINDHLFYFSKETFTQLLSISGFEVVECNSIWHDYIISATVKKRVATDFKVLTDFQDKINQEIQQFFKKYAGKRVGVWGAGHQALAVISLLKIRDKICYVVDSATFKQGKFTPASHLPIVSPEHLIKEPVDAILVMAASYSDEVARTIRDRFDEAIDVTILRDYGLETVIAKQCQ
ncbi:MAG: methyltransferase domain-containing protein [Magnetococcales bacterium]|nr:methyltransferase domain-containing protein [Magnetococcales bacterium]